MVIQLLLLKLPELLLELLLVLLPVKLQLQQLTVNHMLQVNQ